MALYFPGSSPCSICDIVLESSDDAVMHPAILSRDHPLARFSDSVMHRACYEDWEHHAYFETILQKYREIFYNARRPVCRKLGKSISGRPRLARSLMNSSEGSDHRSLRKWTPTKTCSPSEEFPPYLFSVLSVASVASEVVLPFFLRASVSLW
jgi:hypothetical protein